MDSMQNELFQVLEAIFKTDSRQLSLDLSRCVAQTIQTTKHARRQRALAFLLETLTGGWLRKPTRTEVETLLVQVGRLQKLITGNTETTVGLERTEKRLRWLLDHPEGLRGEHQCIACDEWYTENHQCTNTKARGKDSTMAHDSEIQL